MTRTLASGRSRPVEDVDLSRFQRSCPAMSGSKLVDLVADGTSMPEDQFRALVTGATEPSRHSRLILFSSAILRKTLLQ